LTKDSPGVVVVAAVVAERAAAGVAERARVVVGSRAARLREGLPEPGGRLPKRLPAEGALQLAAVLRPIVGRRSVRPAGQRPPVELSAEQGSPGELPAAPQVEAGLRSNRAPARRLPPAAAPLALVRERRQDQPSRLAARKSEPAWPPEHGQVISRDSEPELALRTWRRRGKRAFPACRIA
jgi:hypothetical protein